MSKKAYESGVVIITCDGCSSKHLIADHLGWFDTTQGKIGTIEDIIARNGGDREGNMVVRLRAKDVLTGSDGEGDSRDVVSKKGSGSVGTLADDDGLMEWLPKRADAAAFGIKNTEKQ
ncbi:UNVERIFIED_CONTAM: hypothetical protein HDU68_010348 [Siphonaria sp. JEL0065]|nr:hypothetical protein HDU68_010348 [Siphonaria sp. JEL0065]